MSEQRDDRDTNPIGADAEEMGGATGITGGGESGRPGAGVKAKDHDPKKHGRAKGPSADPPYGAGAGPGAGAGGSSAD
jgi:hypothetical protein